MTEKYMASAANNTLANQTYYSCGLPRKDAMHIFRDPSTGDIPWTGALTGLSVLGMCAYNLNVYIKGNFSLRTHLQVAFGAL
jgi:hypothetical protein